MNTLLTIHGLALAVADYIAECARSLRDELWSTPADRIGYSICAGVLLIVWIAIEVTGGGGPCC